jgi:copper homeostasis protein
VEQLRPHRRTIDEVSAAANAESVDVEVAVESVAGARAAEAAGAKRIELCMGLLVGGLTPSAGLLRAVKASVRIPVFAMLRPRAGDFLYAKDEWDVLLADLRHARALGADGFVGGVLRADGTLDTDRLRELVAAAAPLPITCHRAFDLCADAERALEDLIALGVPRVLTSGQAPSAAAGQTRIRALVQQARGRIAVMAGAGIRDHDVATLVAATGVREVHLSAAARRPGAMTFRRPGVAMGTPSPPDEYELLVTDGAMVARVVNAVRDVR